MQRACKRCEFWDCDEPEILDEDGDEMISRSGPCRRLPPHPHSYPNGYDPSQTPTRKYPFTDANDWCGEFVAVPVQSYTAGEKPCVQQVKHHKEESREQST